MKKLWVTAAVDAAKKSLTASARLLQPTWLLLNGCCHINFSLWKIRPPAAVRLFIEIFWPFVSSWILASETATFLASGVKKGSGAMISSCWLASGRASAHTQIYVPVLYLCDYVQHLQDKQFTAALHNLHRPITGQRSSFHCSQTTVLSWKNNTKAVKLTLTLTDPRKTKLKIKCKKDGHMRDSNCGHSGGSLACYPLGHCGTWWMHYAVHYSH